MSLMAEQTRRTNLTDLVRDRRADLQLSFERLADRCIDPDPDSDARVKSSWLHRLESGLPVIPPQLPQLRALAAGLELRLEVVQAAAAAQFFGIQPDGGPIWSASGDARILVARMDELSPEARKALLDLVEAFTSGNLRITD